MKRVLVCYKKEMTLNSYELDYVGDQEMDQSYLMVVILSCLIFI